MTPLTLASHLCRVVLPDTDEVVMGRGPEKSLGVVLVFEAKELVWVYFSLSPSLSLPLEMTSTRPFKA